MLRLFGAALILVLLPQQLLAADDAKIDIHKIHRDTYELVCRELIFL